MGQVDYTKRKVLLQNLGHVRRIEPAHGAAESARSLQRIYAAGARVGDAVTGLGVDLMALAREGKRREDDRLLAKAAAIIMGQNDRDLLSSDRDDEGRVVGFLNRVGEDCRDLPQLARMKFEQTTQSVADELKLSDDQVERLKLKLSPYARSCDDRLMTHQANEYRRMEIGDASALWQGDVAAIAAGSNTDEMFAATIGDYAHYLDVKGVTGEEAEYERGVFARTLFAGEVKRTVAAMQSEADFDAAIKAAEENPESLFMGNEVLKREMGGAVGKDLHAELLKEMRDARDRFIGRQRHEQALAAERVKGEFVREELKRMGENLPPTELVGFYRDCANDPRLKEASPETALQYLNHAERLEKAIKKGECDATEESLSLRLTELSVREANGEAELHGDRLAAEQAAVWRDYQGALHAGRLSEGFANSFLNRLKNRLTEEERGAMREFYAAFGWHGELDRDGDPSAKARKDWAKERVFAPVDETEPLTGEIAAGRKLTGSQMFELGDTFLRQLRTMGPEAYRGEVMKKVIGEIKARRMASDFSRNRSELARQIFNIQRNLGAEENGKERGNEEAGEGAR